MGPGRARLQVIERSREPQGKKTVKVKERADKEEEKYERQKRKEKKRKEKKRKEKDNIVFSSLLFFRAVLPTGKKTILVPPEDGAEGKKDFTGKIEPC